MKKARNILIVALAICTALSMCVVSGTYAKYTSTAVLSDTARVAKWDIDVEGVDIWSDTIAFDLFTTINDTDGSEEQDVASLADDKVIAPGTTGSFAIDIKNSGEVTAEYTIAFAATNTANIPIEYSLDNSTWTADITTLSTDVLNPVKLEMSAQAATTTTIYWRWAFEGSGSTNFAASQTDGTDTELGKAGTATVVVTATITATQVD